MNAVVAHAAFVPLEVEARMQRHADRDEEPEADLAQGDVGGGATVHDPVALSAPLPTTPKPTPCGLGIVLQDLTAPQVVILVELARGIALVQYPQRVHPSTHRSGAVAVSEVAELKTPGVPVERDVLAVSPSVVVALAMAVLGVMARVARAARAPVFRAPLVVLLAHLQADQRQ